MKNKFLIKSFLGLFLFSLNAFTQAFQEYCEKSIAIKDAVLPLCEGEKLSVLFGDQIGSGSSGKVFANRQDSAKLFKLVPLKMIGDLEAKIALVAGKLGLGPQIFDKAVVVINNNPFLIIEMEKLGASLAQTIRRISSNMGIEDEGNPFELAIAKKFGSEENFYYAFFSTIKKLAKAKISYSDANPGNIIPHKGKLYLIDFGESKFHSSVAEALNVSLSPQPGRFYTTNEYWKKFQNLPDLSSQSIELISWLKKAKN